MELKRLFILEREKVEKKRCGERKRGEGLIPRHKRPLFNSSAAVTALISHLPRFASLSLSLTISINRKKKKKKKKTELGREICPISPLVTLAFGSLN